MPTMSIESQRPGPAITEIRKDFRFEAAHRLPNTPDGHKCFRLHGHSFRISVVVRGPVDPHRGWIVDFADVKSAWDPLHAVLDHNFLNEVDGLENPTSEVLAAWIFQRLDVPGASVHSVTVHETCTASATVYGGE
jgi:6-pyruvoyltetrahydropterin/6-carboxytetrahydropterin synthase